MSHIGEPSQSEVVVRRRSARLNKTSEQPAEAAQPVMTELDSTENPVTAAPPSPSLSEPLASLVRGAKRRNKNCKLQPTRRSKRHNTSSPVLPGEAADKGTPTDVSETRDGPSEPTTEIGEGVVIQLSPTGPRIFLGRNPGVLKRKSQQSTPADGSPSLDEALNICWTSLQSQRTPAVPTAGVARPGACPSAGEEQNACPSASEMGDSYPSDCEEQDAFLSEHDQPSSCPSAHDQSPPESPPNLETSAATGIAAATTRSNSSQAAPESPPSLDATAAPESPTNLDATAIPESPPHPEAGDSDWSDWVEREAGSNPLSATESSEVSTYSEDESIHPAVKHDDSGKRCPRRRPLRNYDEAKEASGRHLDEENTATAGARKTIKKRKRRQNSNVRRGRGMARPRKPSAPECRPELIVVGDAEFDSQPFCSKVVSTIRILTFENMPGPYRTYNMFPTKASYSWGEDEDVQRCLDVFENIASEAYGREMLRVRAKYTEKYGNFKEVWKDFPPMWCPRPEYWRGLCLIWSKERFDQVSTTNRNNKNTDKKVLHHVAGSRSSYRHYKALASQKGAAVGLKELFDRTHMKKTKSGKVYVNDRAERIARSFEHLKQLHGSAMSDEEIWELAVEGEDSRGRMFGFGNKSRTCKLNQSLAADDATISEAARSTATSAEAENERFTKSQVAVLIASKIAAERREFAALLAAQERRHKADFNEFKKENQYNKKCLESLFDRTGAPVPDPSEGSSKGTDGEGANRGGEEPQQSQGED